MISSNNAIEVRNVNKYFKIYNDKGNMLRERIIHLGRNKYEMRHVLKNINFDVAKGESVGIIGTNGCGKSTTLKLLTKILRPNSGTIETNGRIYSMIELGAGFHPDMSGRENIYINASIYGVKAKEVDNKLDDIIRFSELEQYIDNPVRTYSSGMYMRLAFAIAINMDADIILIDEILAVGDQAFQKKCINKLYDLKREGKTIVIVSHTIGQIESVCDKAIWLDNGEIKEIGSSKLVCKNYRDELEQKSIERRKLEQKELKASLLKGEIEDTSVLLLSENAKTEATRIGSGELRYTKVEILNSQDTICNRFNVGDEIRIKLQYKCLSEKCIGRISMAITREDLLFCYGNSTDYIELTYDEEGSAELVIKELMLLPGKYHLDVHIVSTHDEMIDAIANLIDIYISNGGEGEGGVISMKHEWLN